MTCAVQECEGRIQARKLCATHYTRWRRHGDPLVTYGQVRGGDAWGSTPHDQVAIPVGDNSRPRKARDYPAHIVELVRELYLSGMTVREVSSAIPTGFKAQTIIARYGIPLRAKGPKNGESSGPKHGQWRGDNAGYAALHKRVEAARGKPALCEWCDRNGPPSRYYWANISGQYADINDYTRLCASCHYHYDATRRAETGRRTTEGWM